MSTSVPALGEARKAVSGIISSEDPHESARAFAAGSDDTSLLKIAEYALLVPAVKQGMVQYLEGDTIFDSLGCLDPAELSDSIGTELGGQTVRVFQQHPYRQVIDQFARRRSELVSYGNMVFPVENTLRAASLFASSAMLGVAISNGLVINREMPHTQRPRAQFIDSVIRSHQPALARSVMHFLWNDATTSEFYEHVEGFVIRTPKANQEAMAYDSLRDCAVLAKPLTRWVVSDDLREIGDIPIEDARVGCPFSFEPELLKRFYEHIVDAMEQKQCWPDMIADQDAVMRMRQLGASAMESKSGKPGQ